MRRIFVLLVLSILLSASAYAETRSELVQMIKELIPYSQMKAKDPSLTLADYNRTERWTPDFGQAAKVESRPSRRSLECHGRDGSTRLS